MKQYEVLVMIPQILVHCLSHCLMKMDSIALLIFDECHHAQVQSNHPYSEIMRVFYKTAAMKCPRIFGMTTSPVIRKGASSEGNLAKSINSLESLLDAKVNSVEDKNDLDSFVASAIVRMYYYDLVVNGTSSPYIAYCNKLGDLKREALINSQSNSALEKSYYSHFFAIRQIQALVSSLSNSALGKSYSSHFFAIRQIQVLYRFWPAIDVFWRLLTTLFCYPPKYKHFGGRNYDVLPCVWKSVAQSIDIHRSQM